MSILAQVPIPPIPPTPPDFGGVQEVIVRTDPSWLATLPPQMIAMVIISGLIVAGIVLYPLLKAIAMLIAGTTRNAEIDPAEFEEMRRRITELEERQSQVRELEDRVDFAERLLAERSRDEIRVERGGGAA